MRVIVQRVSEASVSVAHEVVGQIQQGLLVFAGFEESDTADDLQWMAQKLLKLRIFSDANGIMNCNVAEINGEILAVSQFTLYASTRKGNRPSWSRAARGEVSQPLFEQFLQQLRLALGRDIATGLFGADMQIKLINDGPVTISMDSKNPE